MFSGAVLVASLRTLGSSTGTVCVITGMVIMNTISSTNMTSTSGVVLISDMARSSSSAGGGANMPSNELIELAPRQLVLRMNVNYLRVTAAAGAPAGAAGRAGAAAGAPPKSTRAPLTRYE